MSLDVVELVASIQQEPLQLYGDSISHGSYSTTKILKFLNVLAIYSGHMKQHITNIDV